MLDPRAAAVEDSIPLPDPKPATIRRFGRFPSTDRMLPGDLLLFSAVNPKLPSRLIVAAQEQGGFSIDHACWHHAAIYIGLNRIVHAVPQGVRQGPMYDYIGSHKILCRRDSQLSSDERYRIVIEALVRLGQRYDFGRLPKLLWDSFLGYWQAALLTGTTGAICSQVYADAYMFVTNRLVVPGMYSDIKPADLSASNRLEDVQLCWRTIL